MTTNPIAASYTSQTTVPRTPILQSIVSLRKRYVYKPPPVPKRPLPTPEERETILQGWYNIFEAISLVGRSDPSLSDKCYDVVLKTGFIIRDAYRALIDAVKRMFKYIQERFELLASVITMIASSLMQAFKQRSKDVVNFFKTIYSYFPSCAPDMTAEEFQKHVEQGRTPPQATTFVDRSDIPRRSKIVTDELGTVLFEALPSEESDSLETDTELQNGDDETNEVDVGIFAYICTAVASITTFFEGLGNNWSVLDISVARFTKTLSTCFLVERFDLYGKARKIANIVYHFITGNHLYEDFEMKSQMITSFREMNMICDEFNYSRHPPLNKIRLLRELKLKFVTAYEYCIVAFPRDGQQWNSMKRVVDEKILRFIGCSLSNTRRIKPVVIMLMGPAACGKTTVQDTVIHDVMTKIAEVYTSLGPSSPGLDIFRDHASRPSHMSRNCVEKPPEYDDGYNECLFYCLEEFLTVKDAAIRNEWMNKLFALSDTQPLMLNMAFGDKGQRFFDSPFIITTGNEGTIPLDLADPDAFYRRIDFCLNVTLPNKGAFNIDNVRFKIHKESHRILSHKKFPHTAYQACIKQNAKFNIQSFDIVDLIFLITACYLERNNPDNAAKFQFTRVDQVNARYDMTKLSEVFTSARTMTSVHKTDETVIRHKVLDDKGKKKEKNTTLQGPGDDTPKVPLHILYQTAIKDILEMTPAALHRYTWIARKMRETMTYLTGKFDFKFRQHRVLATSPYLAYIELRKAILGKQHIIETTWNRNVHNVNYIQKTIIWLYSEMSALFERASHPNSYERSGEAGCIGPMGLRKAYCTMTSKQRETIRTLVKNESLPWKFGITIAQEQNNVRIIEGRNAFLARRRDANRARKRAADERRAALRAAARQYNPEGRSGNIDIVNRSIGLGNWADYDEDDQFDYDELYTAEDDKLYHALQNEEYDRQIFEETDQYERGDIVHVERHTRLQAYIPPPIAENTPGTLDEVFDMLANKCWDGVSSFSLFRRRTPISEIFDKTVTEQVHYKACLARFYSYYKLDEKGIEKHAWLTATSSGIGATNIYDVSPLRENCSDPILAFVYTLYINSTISRNTSINVEQARRILSEAQYAPPFKALTHEELDFAAFATDIIQALTFKQCVISAVKNDNHFNEIMGIISSLMGIALTAGLIAVVVKFAKKSDNPLDGMSKEEKIKLYESMREDEVLQSLDIKKLQVHPKMKNTFAKFQEKHHTHLQSGADDCLFQKVMNNMYACCLPFGAVAGSILFLGGGIAVMPAHVYDAIPNFRLIPYNPQIALKYPGMSTFYKETVKVLSRDPERDEIYLAFADIRRHPKIVEHLATEEEYSREFTQPVMLAFDQTGSLDGRVESVSNILKVEDTPRNLNYHGQVPMIVTRRINYDWSNAIAGSCGSIGMAKVGGRYKIAWRHTSGNPHEHYGTGLPLSYERAIPFFSNVHEGTSTSLQCGEDVCFSDVDYLIVDGKPAYEYVDDEFVTPIMTSPTNKTVFRATPFQTHEFKGGATTAPACLDEEAYLNARAKEAKAAPVLNPDPEVSVIVHAFGDHIVKLFHTIPAKHVVGCRTLTPREALYGYGNLGPLSKKTADGLRVKMMGRRKTEYEDPDCEATEEFVTFIHFVHGVVKETGVFPLQINVDCQKDETRPLDRVESKSSRLFNITDFVDNVLIKMAIGDLVSKTAHTLSLDPAMCGINPVSSYWLDVYNKFCGLSVVFTDISGFDYTNVLWTIRVIGKYLYLAYGHDRVALRWAMWSFISCLYAIRFNRRKGRVLGRGNTSGNYATTYWNTLVNIVYHGVACVHGALKNGSDPLLALANLKLVIYSDDNVSACPGHLWWNTKFLSTAFDKLFHITLTATDKSATQDRLYTIDEAEFLSRSFVKRDGIVYAPLSLESLLSQLYWVRAPKKYATRAFIMSQLQINLDNVMRELIEYEPNQAWELVNEIQNFIQEHKIPVIVHPFDFYKQVELKLSYY